MSFPVTAVACAAPVVIDEPQSVETTSTPTERLREAGFKEDSQARREVEYEGERLAISTFADDRGQKAFIARHTASGAERAAIYDAENNLVRELGVAKAAPAAIPTTDGVTPADFAGFTTCLDQFYNVCTADAGCSGWIGSTPVCWPAAVSCRQGAILLCGMFS